ncbi:hypothetical protein [Candidatus Poriferisodalis sp.]|uniref:hypothetical protein n=1 Tax=Candidatus Poriferisodalis sp. TaxID=3101277 RepID=UPI003B52DD02
MSRRGLFSRIFRRRPKPAFEPNAGADPTPRGRKKKDAPPADWALDPSPQAQAESPSGEPWYKHTGPLFDESFNDGVPAVLRQRGDAALLPPSEVLTAASVLPPPIPRIQANVPRDDPAPPPDPSPAPNPGPLPSEQFDVFGPQSSAAQGPPPAQQLTRAGDNTPHAGAEEVRTHAPPPQAPPVSDLGPDPQPHREEVHARGGAGPAGGGPVAASALPATSPPSEVAQNEPPMVVPIRGYYFTRSQDTLRSVAAQFMNAPERWAELRALNGAYPGIADADPDALLAEGTALALPGDPLPWGRPDPVYLWTLAETFLFTAWGREPTPDEVAPFWRGLTRGTVPEGEQPPTGTELPGIAEIAARSFSTAAPPTQEGTEQTGVPAELEMPAGDESERADDEPSPAVPEAFEPRVPPVPEAFEPRVPPVPEAPEPRVPPVPEAFEPRLPPEPEAPDAPEAQVGIAAEADTVLDTTADTDIEADVESEPAVGVPDGPVTTAEQPPTEQPTFAISPIDAAVAPEEDTAEGTSTLAAEPVAAEPFAAEPVAPEPAATEFAFGDDPLAVEDAEAIAELVGAVEEAIEDVGIEDVGIEDVGIEDVGIEEITIDEVGIEDVGIEEITIDEVGIADVEIADVTVEHDRFGSDYADTDIVDAEFADTDFADADTYVDADIVDAVIVDDEPFVAEFDTAQPAPPIAPDFDPSVEPHAPTLEPPPSLEEWLGDPAAVFPGADSSAPYAGLPTAEDPETQERPPEAEAPRVPHFLPSVTGATPGAPATPPRASPVTRGLAGTAVGDAMMLWQIARRRRQSRRGSGMPDGVDPSLQFSEGNESLELIEAAMRHLYAVTVGQQRPAPQVLAVRTGTYGFEVLLDEPFEAPPGWREASGGYVLELPPGITARDLGAVADGPSLCPALVPVGNTYEGPLLLNLEQMGCLAVSGPSAAAASLLSAIVATLGSSPMVGDLRITAVGLDNAAGSVGWETVRFVSYDSTELEDLLTTASSPEDGVGEMLVIGPGNDLVIQRAGQVATAPGSRLSLVGATSAVSARWPWRIHVDDTGTALVHPIAITMTAARVLPPEMLAQLGGMTAGGIDPAQVR